MKYLDFHQHYGFLEYRGTKMSYSSNPDREFEEIVIENCKKLDMVVAVNGLGIEPGFRLVDKNDEVEKFFKENPDYIIGIGFVDLDYHTPACVDNLYKRGFKAIKTHAPLERYDSGKYFKIYERCQYFGLPILFHTGISAANIYKCKKGSCSFNMHPIFLEKVAVNFPKLQVIGAHLGGGFYDVACVLASTSHYENDNIRFDISIADHGRRKIQEGNYIKNDIPISNVLWGLDEPPIRYEELIDDWNKYFDKVGLTKEEKDMIFYKNACDLLNINY